ncbi:hypothetical protein Tco_0316794 [Tanacetum coccineum]
MTGVIRTHLDVLRKWELCLAVAFSQTSCQSIFGTCNLTRRCSLLGGIDHDKDNYYPKLLISSKTMQGAIEVTTELMDEKTHAYAVSSGRKQEIMYDDLSIETIKNQQQQNKRKTQAQAYNAGNSPVHLGAITAKRLAIWPRIVEADLQMLTTTTVTTTIIIRREMVAMRAELKDTLKETAQNKKQYVRGTSSGNGKGSDRRVPDNRSLVVYCNLSTNWLLIKLIKPPIQHIFMPVELGSFDAIIGLDGHGTYRIWSLHEMKELSGATEKEQVRQRLYKTQFLPGEPRSMFVLKKDGSFSDVH